jgi:hypothetical protein
LWLRVYPTGKDGEKADQDRENENHQEEKVK